MWSRTNDRALRRDQHRNGGRVDGDGCGQTTLAPLAFSEYHTGRRVGAIILQKTGE
ncbi:MAG: hypothetical protein ACK5PS_13585 [Desulfopila sp.]